MWTYLQYWQLFLVCEFYQFKTQHNQIILLFSRGNAMQWLAQCHYLCKSRIREGLRKAKYFKILDYFLDYYFSRIYYTMYSLIIHLFSFIRKQNEATSATEINVSRCLLWKYVMSNTNLSHDYAGSAHDQMFCAHIPPDKRWKFLFVQ